MILGSGVSGIYLVYYNQTDFQTNVGGKNLAMELDCIK